MLTMLIGKDWTANQNEILAMLSKDVADRLPGRILLVPELISHDMERRLCAAAGDTCSRYAEVLSFSRLTRRICDWAGCAVQECLDEGGRLVAMASAARQLHSKLKAYASVETRPEFLCGLVDAIDEFKRCCVSAEDLYQASQNAEGAFAQKLEELSLLLQTYDGICAHGKRDPRDQLTWGLEQLEDCDFAQKHVFYIDGFPDFTQQNMAVIAHLIRYSPHVIISMNCDTPGSANLAFEKAGQTAGKLLKIAKQEAIPTEVRLIEPRRNPLQQVCGRLFQGNTKVPAEAAEKIHAAQYDSIHEECSAAADHILELVHSGARFRDISVVCPDLQNYSNALSMHLQLCDIPAYLAGTEEILEKSVVSTVLTALDAAIGGFERKDVLRYLKSPLSELDLQTCDRIENYSLLWEIDGKKWLEPWTGHPEGLVDSWEERHYSTLGELNAARSVLIDPLAKLNSRFRSATKLKQQVDAICSFLNDIHMDQKLQELAVQMDQNGDKRNAQILNQLWEILLTALEQLSDILGETVWDKDTFVRLLRLLLSQYDVGTIPTVLDAVMIGPVSAMRCHHAKYLIVVGASEGKFPTYGSISGILSDQERNALRMLGVPLTGGALEGLQIEFSEIYGVFCGTEENVYVSSQRGQASFIFRRLLEMAGKEYIPALILGAATVNRQEAASLLVRQNDRIAAQALGVEAVFDVTQRKKMHILGTVERENVDKLYGTKLNLSASQVDRQAECRLSYFLKYGLRAKEQKPAAVDPAEFGTYIHAVLEQTARQICQKGGFKAVSLEETLQIANRYSDAYISTHFSQIDSQRITYLFQRNNRELMMVVEELWNELQNSSFIPFGFEVAFGDGAQLDAIDISGNTMPAQLRGFVDRVDVWKEGSRNYYRVVDYKTGKKDFDYCDVYNGLGLQMLLYLFALQQHGQALLGPNPIPAGVQYFPARVPLLTADSELTDEEAAGERQSLWKRKGLILGDDDVLFAMENAEQPIRLSCKRKKDGTVTGDIATKEQLQLLSRYVFHLLGRMVDEIASGNVDPNPYTRGNSHNACRFCPYGMICHSATVEDRRNYKTISSKKFWEDIEKEMKELG